MATRTLTALIEREGDGFVGLCPAAIAAGESVTLGELDRPLEQRP